MAMTRRLMTSAVISRMKAAAISASPGTRIPSKVNPASTARPGRAAGTASAGMRHSLAVRRPVIRPLPYAAAAKVSGSRRALIVLRG